MKILTIIFTICLAISGCQQSISQYNYHLPLRQDLIKGQLDNGMRYIIVQNQQPKDRISLQLIVHVGSLDEADDQKGIAHLVEHMAFNGTKQFPSNTLIEHQEALGMVFGRDVNAMTEYSTTSYFLHLPNNSDTMMNEGFNMLAQQASALTFDQHELEKERLVVEEEWRSGLNMRARMGTENRKILLANSRYGDREPIGDMELVRHVDASRIKDFWQDWYHPNNMTLIVVGDTTKEQVTKMLDKYFADMPAKTLPSRSSLTLPLENKLQLYVIADAEITTEVLSFNFRNIEKKPETQSELRAQILNELTMQMLNKRLREHYYVESKNVSKMMMMARPIVPGYNNNRLMVLVNGTDYLATASEALAELSRYTQHGFVQSDLNTVRQTLINRYTQISDSMRKTTNSRIMMSIFNRLRSHSPLIDHEKLALIVQDISNEITVNDINIHLKKMVTELNPVIIAQIKPTHTSLLPTQSQLVSVWEKVKENPPPKTEPVIINSPLLANIPTKSKILSHQEKNGIHIWQLENGTTVWFEFSDDTSDQLLIDYRGWGGTQHLPLNLHRAAQQLRYMSKFGYADFSNEQLIMLNSGYSNRIMPFINQDNHGFLGSTDRHSLENWLQNMYLQITQPQVNKEIWKSTQLLIEKGIKNRKKTANGQFNSAIDNIRYVHNPDLLSLTKEQLYDIDSKKLLLTWNKLFGNAKNNQLVIIGNAKPQNIIELAQRYVGTLPSDKQTYTQLQLPKLAKGKHQIQIAAGEEPLAVTSILFNKNINYATEIDNEAYLLSRIISKRLRESLREASGGVYSVRFGIRLDRDRNQAHGLISYSHDPARSHELKEKTLDEINKIIVSGVTKQELHEVIEQTKYALQSDNITDRQRMTYLKAAAQYNDSLTAIDDYIKWIDSVTPKKINLLAQQIMNTNNWIDATLIPENTKIRTH